MLKFLSKRLNNKKGFTLIELIVVIAIIGILAAIVVPRIGSFRTSAAESAHNANIRTLEGAAIMYVAETGLPTELITWDKEKTDEWDKYISEWPKVPKGLKASDGKLIEDDYEVEIDTDGKVTVNHEKTEPEEP